MMQPNEFSDAIESFSHALRESFDVRLLDLPDLVNRAGLPACFDTVVVTAGPLFREEPIARIEFGNPPTSTPALATVGGAREDTTIKCIGGFTWLPASGPSELIISVRLPGEAVMHM